MNLEKKYNSLLKHICSARRPIVLVNACTHGDELIGLEVIKKLESVKVKKGTLLFNIANEKALNSNQRFIDSDLNRSFPGHVSGSHESTLAHYMTKVIREVDVFIDVHSTTTETKDLIIVEKLDRHTRRLIRSISPKRVLHFVNPSHNTTISAAKVGLGFEYGNDLSIEAIDSTARGILRVLASLEMIDSVLDRGSGGVDFYHDIRPIIKPKGFKLLPSIKNFDLIKSGEAYAQNDEQSLVAQSDMYPILFGNDNYEDIFGFAAFIKETEEVLQENSRTTMVS